MSKIELLQAEVQHEGETLYLRIKKVNGKKEKVWRIRYLSVNKKFIENKPKRMNYFLWKKKHHQYRTRLRANGVTLELAAEKMLESIELLKKGERKLSDY